jgi:hypothetical protein
MFAPTVRALKNEGAYAVLAAATALEKEGKNIVHFEIGQPDYPTPKHVVDVSQRSDPLLVRWIGCVWGFAQLFSVPFCDPYRLA